MEKEEFNIGVCAKDLQGDLAENLVWLSQNGFKSFQVWKPQLPPSFKSASELLNRCLDLDLKISAVGGGPNLVDPSEAKRSLYKFKEFMDLSVELECRIVAAETKMLPKDITSIEAWKVCVDNIAELCDYAEKVGVVLAIECAGPCFIKDQYDWMELKKHIPSQALKVNFDAANIAWARQDPIEACEVLLEDIVHTHIKDIKYLPEINQMEHEENQDCVLGQGIIDYRSVIRRLLKYCYKGAFCIEMHAADQDRKHDILKSKIELEQLLNNLETDQQVL